MKILKGLIKLIFTIGIILSLVICYMGYSTYKEVIKKGDVVSMVNIIRDDHNFTENDNISKDFLDSIVAIEDIRFYKHGPVETRSLVRALLINLKSGTLLQGGSTITQQVAKNIYLDNDATLPKKIAEMIIAYELEKEYSKAEILELYVNIIYYGDNNYGIEEASKNYFGKEPLELDFDESTLLAGLPQSPSRYALSKGMDLARERQIGVIKALDEYRDN